LIYTVDEVSDLLSIPRPTLYRYLREYSIPHVRRSGKISIPEESFDRIKEARELHREGLGTPSVRRRLREGNDPVDAEELTEQLDRLSGALENLQGDLTSPVGASSLSQETLQTILEKQDLLISAVSNLTEMVEDTLSTSVRPRVAPSNGMEAGTRREKNAFEQPQGRIQTIERKPLEKEPAKDDFATEDLSESVASLTAPARHEKFGTLSRRRRIVLVVLLALLTSTILAWSVPAVSERVFEQPAPDEQSVEEDSQSAPAVTEEASPTPQTVEVPDLIGMALPEAEDELAEAGLKLGAWNEIPNYEVPVGRVVVQGPQASEEVDPETPVDVIVSSGPPLYQPEVPVSNIDEGVGTNQFAGGGTIPPPGPFQQ
jgi:excisionase family DNA binding protein